MLIKKDRPRKIAVLPASMSISWWKRMWRNLGLAPYWIRCDGRNDQDAFHEAYDFLPKNPGGEVYVAAGVYQPVAQITVPVANANTRGAGMENTIIERTHNDVYTFAMALNKNYSTLRDLTINGSGRAAATAEIAAYGQYQKVERVKVLNYKGHGIEVTEKGGLINKCIFDGEADGTNGSLGVWTNSGADQLKIMLTSFFNHNLGGVFIVGAEGFRIGFNYFFGNHIQTDPTGGGQLAIAGNGETNQKGTIVGNIFGEGGSVATSGMEIDGGGMTITGNIVRSQGNHGIVLQRDDDNLVSANIISNCGQDNGPNAGIYVPATGYDVSGFTIVGNKCFDDQGVKTMDYGIWIADAQSDKFVIIGNNCCDVKTDGILNAAGVGATKIMANNLECPNP